MSRFITALIIFSLIIAGSVSSVFYVSKNEEELQKHLDEIIDAVEENDMTKAELLSEKFVEKFNKIEPYIIMLVRHHNVDEITKYSSRLPSYCAYGEKADIVAEVNLIKSLLKHMSDDEMPVFHNFF